MSRVRSRSYLMVLFGALLCGSCCVGGLCLGNVTRAGAVVYFAAGALVIGFTFRRMRQNLLAQARAEDEAKRLEQQQRARLNAPDADKQDTSPDA